jgi:hypothetical protein
MILHPNCLSLVGTTKSLQEDDGSAFRAFRNFLEEVRAISSLVKVEKDLLTGSANSL